MDLGRGASLVMLLWRTNVGGRILAGGADPPVSLPAVISQRLQLRGFSLDFWVEV
jgi:hypothetical protein